MTELAHAVERLEQEVAKGPAPCWMGEKYGNPHALGSHPDCLMCEAILKEQAPDIRDDHCNGYGCPRCTSP